jgi:hypothetical protein
MGQFQQALDIISTILRADQKCIEALFLKSWCQTDNLNRQLSLLMSGGSSTGETGFVADIMQDGDTFEQASPTQGETESTGLTMDHFELLEEACQTLDTLKKL